MIKRVLIGLVIWLACVAADALSLAWMLIALLRGSPRFWSGAVAKDQAVNAAVLGGSEDETISSRAARAAQRGERWGCVLCKLLDKFDRNHCRDAAGT
jgi:hypothetical protein